MNKLKFFYSAAVMGYGQGRWWHKFYNFPKFPAVTKTLTRIPKHGYPFAVIRWHKSIYNKISLHNVGFTEWCNKYYNEASIVSIAGTDTEIEGMVYLLDKLDIQGIELNFSCPNIKNYDNKRIPNTRHDLYLKLNYKMDPYRYQLDNIKGIRVNAIPLGFCGGSGRIAKDKNWGFIKQFGKELNVAGCSFNTFDDIKKLEDLGCNEIGIGSVILINPKLVEEMVKLWKQPRHIT